MILWPGRRAHLVGLVFECQIGPDRVEFLEFDGHGPPIRGQEIHRREDRPAAAPANLQISLVPEGLEWKEEGEQNTAHR